LAVVGVWSYAFLDILIPMPGKVFWYKLYGARIKKGTAISGRIIDCPNITLGEDVAIGEGSLISGHWVGAEQVYLGPVNIGDEAMIGSRSIISPGVKIGEKSSIGAGAFVPQGREIPAHETWAGVPAKKIKSNT